MCFGTPFNLGGTMIVIGMRMEGKWEQEAIARDVRKFLDEKGYSAQVEVRVVNHLHDVQDIKDRVIEEYVPANPDRG